MQFVPFILSLSWRILVSCTIPEMELLIFKSQKNINREEREDSGDRTSFRKKQKQTVKNFPLQCGVGMTDGLALFAFCKIMLSTQYTENATGRFSLLYGDPCKNQRQNQNKVKAEASGCHWKLMQQEHLVFDILYCFFT